MVTMFAKSRFFIALLPPQEVQDYAREVIEDLSDRYKTSTAKAPPHITLQSPFEWLMEDLPRLMLRLQQIGQQCAPVSVTLAGFGAFRPRVLYLNVLKTPDLMALQATLMATLETELGVVDPSSQHRSFTPHLTIASRNVTRQTFHQAWAELEPRPVEFQFVSDRLTLLIHDGQRWQIHSSIPLTLQSK